MRQKKGEKAIILGSHSSLKPLVVHASMGSGKKLRQIVAFCQISCNIQSH